MGLLWVGVELLFTGEVPDHLQWVPIPFQVLPPVKLNVCTLLQDTLVSGTVLLARRCSEHIYCQVRVFLRKWQLLPPVCHWPAGSKGVFVEKWLLLSSLSHDSVLRGIPFAVWVVQCTELVAYLVPYPLQIERERVQCVLDGAHLIKLIRYSHNNGTRNLSSQTGTATSREHDKTMLIEDWFRILALASSPMRNFSVDVFFAPTER